MKSRWATLYLFTFSMPLKTMIVWDQGKQTYSDTEPCLRPSDLMPTYAASASKRETAPLMRIRAQRQGRRVASAQVIGLKLLSISIRLVYKSCRKVGLVAELPGSGDAMNL